MGTVLPKMLGATLGGLMLVVGTAGCVGHSSSDAGAAATSTAQSAPAVADLDTYHPEDTKFYESLRFGDLLARPPIDVPAAAERAAVVVVARIRDVAAQRVIGDLQTAGIQLEVVDILHGQLRPELAGKVVVEFPLGDPGDATRQVAALRAALPQGPGIWFLRWQGRRHLITKPDVKVGSDLADPSLYGLVHMHTMFVQGRGEVVNPLGYRDPGPPPLVGVRADAERFAKLSQLADYLRAVP